MKAGWQGYGICIWCEEREGEIAMEKVKHSQSPRSVNPKGKEGQRKGRNERRGRW